MQYQFCQMQLAHHLYETEYSSKRSLASCNQHRGTWSQSFAEQLDSILSQPIRPSIDEKQSPHRIAYLIRSRSCQAFDLAIHCVSSLDLIPNRKQLQD